MSVAASRPPAPAVAAPAPAAPLAAPTPADREPAPHPFAEMLRQSRGVERQSVAVAKPAPADIAPTRTGSASEAPPAGDESMPTSDGAPKSDAGRARARAATAPRSAARSTGNAERPEPAGERSAERSAQDDDRSPSDTSAATANPALALRPDASRPADADLRFGSAAHRSTAAAGAGSKADADATGGIESGAEPDAGAARRGDVLARVDTGRSAARARDGDTATAATSFDRILADAKASDRPAAAASSLEAPSLPATSIAAAEAQAPAASDNAPAAQSAALSVPVDSPEFAAAFGVQVSVFVGDGVQQAELHLNPAETGPVSIAITVEGSQAHVEFGADLAATRQAIENGLPALASALRDAGFTLAGGGVSQHSRSGGSGGRGDDSSTGSGRPGGRAGRGSEAISVSPTVQRTSHRLAAGGIDLYA